MLPSPGRAQRQRGERFTRRKRPMAEGLHVDAESSATARADLDVHEQTAHHESRAPAPWSVRSGMHARCVPAPPATGSKSAAGSDPRTAGLPDLVLFNWLREGLKPAAPAQRARLTEFGQDGPRPMFCRRRIRWLLYLRQWRVRNFVEVRPGNLRVHVGDARRAADIAVGHARQCHLFVLLSSRDTMRHGSRARVLGTILVGPARRN